MIGAVPDQEASMSKAITTAAVVASLLVAAPASAHTIDVRVAAEAVKTSASALGEVDRAKCWRPMVGTKRARHRAICAAWWVHTPGASCAIFYEARMAAHPSRRLLVIPTFQPWCATAPRDLTIDVQGHRDGGIGPDLFH
jgi:hypothetical protein